MKLEKKKRFVIKNMSLKKYKNTKNKIKHSMHDWNGIRKEWCAIALLVMIYNQREKRTTHK